MTLRKALIVCQFAGGPGMGMVSRPWKIACALKKEYSVTIVCSRFSHTRTCNSPPQLPVTSCIAYKFLPTIVPLKLYLLLPRFFQSALFSISLAVYFFFEGRRTNLLINSIPSHFQFFPVFLLKSFSPGLFVILDIRDLWSYAIKYYGSSRAYFSLLRSLASHFFFFCEKSAIRSANIVTSVFEVQVIAQYFGESCEDFFFLRNGFNGSNLAEIDPYLRIRSSRSGLMDDSAFAQRELSFVYSGSLSSSIAFEDFLGAFVSLCQSGRIHARLYLASPNPMSLPVSHSKYVSCLGPLDQQELADLFSRVDIAVTKTSDSPVFLKGVSLTKYADYMLSSLPVLDIVNCNTTAVTQAKCGVHALPSSREDISNAILTICSMTHVELQSLGRRGRDWALSNLDMDLSMDKLLARLV